MKIFCDTNILVAGFSAAHPQHNAARPALERVLAGKDQGFVAAHTLAECYAVLTRLPGEACVAPATAWQLISENVIKHFTVVHLNGKEYGQALQKASVEGVAGGKTYDALLLAAAEKSDVDRILTLNVRHFESLAEENLRGKITAP